jgi:hypothetical protein
MVIFSDHNSRLARWNAHSQEISNVRMEIVADAEYFVSVQKADQRNALVGNIL